MPCTEQLGTRLSWRTKLIGLLLFGELILNEYDEVHVFIDESGDITGKKESSEKRLVGGVVVFGAYDRDSEEQLGSLLRHDVRKAGGRYPYDLHFSNREFQERRGEGRWRALLSNVRESVHSWTTAGREAYGVVMQHGSDLFQKRSFFAEASDDTRYFHMLSSLIEHVLFVNPISRDRLCSNARVHLHVASRSLPFPNDNKTKEWLKSQGYQILTPGKGTSRDGPSPKKAGSPRDRSARREKPSEVFALKMVNKRELASMLRTCLRTRWSRSDLDVDDVEVVKAEYEPERIEHEGRQPAQTPVGLYLADLLLGQVRRDWEETVVPMLERMIYGPESKTLAEMQSALDHENIDGYWHSFRQLLTQEEDQSEYATQVVERQRAQVLALTSRAHEKAAELVEETCKEGDTPGMAKHGLRVADRLDELLSGTELYTTETQVRLIQARLACANHTGDAEMADAAWREYAALEPQLVELGAKGLQLKAEMRNRRAVSLTDLLRYDEAERILEDLISAEQSVLETLASQFGVPADSLPDYELGACYGTLGQVYAFKGTANSAEACFRHALTRFSEESDRQRQWIYLGHLACDVGARGRSLWDEVGNNVPELSSMQPIAQPGAQYALALQLKGMLVFGSNEQVAEFCQIWDDSKPLDAYSPDARAEHPFGLIHQSLALLCARLCESTEDSALVMRANQEFAEAHRLLESGGPILQLLGCICWLRWRLFALDTRANEQTIREELDAGIQSLRQHLVENFGEHAWAETETGSSCGIFGSRDIGSRQSPEVRARDLVETIGFNYW